MDSEELRKNLEMTESELAGLRRITRNIFEKAEELERELNSIEEVAEEELVREEDLKSPEKAFKLLEDTKVRTRRAIKSLNKVMSSNE